MTEKCTNCPAKKCIAIRIPFGEYSVAGRLEMKYQHGKCVSTKQIGETIEECVAKTDDLVRQIYETEKYWEQKGFHEAMDASEIHDLAERIQDGKK